MYIHLMQPHEDREHYVTPPRAAVKETRFLQKCLAYKRGGVPLYMGYIGMCRCELYGFQAVYSSIGYINQSVWV